MKNKLNEFRPKSFKEFYGQKRIIEQLKVYLYSSKKREKTLDHILLCGPSGTGKTTLSYIIANELRKNIKTINAPMIESNQDIVEILALLKEGDILFIDEIHRLDKKIEEVLYSAMDDFILSFPYKSEERTKVISLNVPPFTLIGATTIDGLISTPLRERFPIRFNAEPYTLEDISKIIENNAKKINLEFKNSEAILELAKRSELNPRICNNLLKRLYDFSIYKRYEKINEKNIQNFFNFASIHEDGLTESDIKILTILFTNFYDQPVGLEAISNFLNEDQTNIKENYEPFLVKSGYLMRTKKGRILTSKGKEYYLNFIDKK